MDALLLGGLSKKSNKEWIYEVEECVKPYFEKVAVVHYDHWDLEGEQAINFSVELEKVVKLADLLEKQYIIIAKSIGSRLVLQALLERRVNPVEIFICGLPYSLEVDNGDLLVLLERNKLPTVILQNVDEKYIIPQDLRKLLEHFDNYLIIEGESGGHSYQAEVVADVVKEYLKK